MQIGVKHKMRLTLTGVSAVIVSQISACGKTDFVAGESNTRHPEQSVDSGDQQRKKTTKQELNAIFKLQKPSLGLAQSRNNAVPAIYPPTVHHESLFFQVHRCPSEIRVEGLFDSFDESHPALTEQGSARNYFERNEFWTDVERKCSAVSQFHPQSEILDITAPSGSWKWYIRTCIFEPGQREIMCNPAISATDALKGYQSQRNEFEQQLLSKISQKITRINQISMTLPNRSNAMMSAIDSCDSIRWDKAKRSLYKSVILNVIGMGSAIALEIFAPNQNGQPSWQDKLRTIWAPPESNQILGQAITRILLWLFTDKNDFHESCVAAEEIRAQVMNDVLLLKSMQIELANDLDAAERMALPLPAGIQR